MKQAVVWGAGRIGRGFVAELLFEGDYFVHFVDRDASLVRALNRQGRYTLYKTRETGLEKCVLAGNFLAHSTDEDLSSLFLQEDCLVDVAVFKNDLESAAEMLAPYVALRAEKMPRSPMDFITNVNMNAPEVAFRRYLEQRLSGPARDYLDAQVGVSGIFMMCIAPDATEEMRREDPLAVYHNGFFEQAVDAEAFRGVPPQAPRLRLSHRLAAEEARKLYTLNMAHCALAYLGAPRGYATSFQAVQDAKIRRVVAGALEEASLGLEKQLGFGGEEMLQWREDYLLPAAQSLHGRSPEPPGRGQPPEAFRKRSAGDPRAAVSGFGRKARKPGAYHSGGLRLRKPRPRHPTGAPVRIGKGAGNRRAGNQRSYPRSGTF